MGDDPFDDFSRILHAMGEKPCYPPFPPRKSGGFSELLDAMSAYAENLEPRLNSGEWKHLLSEIFSAKYGGTRVRIKKSPAAAMKYDAKRLTPKELMLKHGISRSYAYKLRRDALMIR